MSHHWMWFAIVSWLAWSEIVAAQAQPAGPLVSIQEDAKANGWDVHVSFKAAPTSYGRAAHAWSAEHAKELAQQLVNKHAHLRDGLAVAAVRIQGKDGNGIPTPAQRQRLADWPLVEHQFKSRAMLNSDAVNKSLSGIAVAYRAASSATDEILNQPTPAPTDAQQQAVEQAYRSYNEKFDQLAKDLFKGEAPPLPKLRPLPKDKWKDHAVNCDELLKAQKRAELIRAAMRNAETEKQKSTLNALLKDALDGSPLPEGTKEQDILDYAREYYRRSQALEQCQQEADKVNKALQQQQDALDAKIADPSALRPPADQFAPGAKYAPDSSPSNPSVFKTDDKGQVLPDDKQPPGYPKPLAPGDSPGAGEKALVDPELRVQLLDAKGDVKAGVFGKVVDVDKDAGTVTLQVDDSGDTLKFSGINPKALDEGAFVQPDDAIGTPQAPPPGQAPQVGVSGQNPGGASVDPRQLLDFAKMPLQKPGSNSLKRAVPDPNPTPLPVKQDPSAPPESGGKANKVRLDFDEGAQKSLESGTYAKNTLLASNETLAKGALNRATDAQQGLIDSSGLLKAKLKQLNSELKDANAKTKDLAKQVSDLNAKVKGDEQRIAADREALVKKKRELDAERARLEGTKDKAAIAAFNKTAMEHWKLVDKYEADKKALSKDQDALRNAKKDQKQNQQTRNNLQKDIDQLQPRLNQAQSALDDLQKQINDQKQRLKSILNDRIK